MHVRTGADTDIDNAGREGGIEVVIVRGRPRRHFFEVNITPTSMRVVDDAYTRLWRGISSFRVVFVVVV